MQFLKRHYEKIILCVVLLSLAGASIWMGEVIRKLSEEVSAPIPEGDQKTRRVVALNLSNDLLVLSQITNPPPVVLSGEHNLFNPVTWRRKANGELLKILKTGPDALSLTNVTPLYTVIAYDHPSGNGAVYIMSIQVHSARRPNDYAKVGEKAKSGLYIIRGTEGAVDNPTGLKLEILDTQETVSVTTNEPYKRVDGYLADMRYEPESRTLSKMRVNETFTLDSEPYKIIEITNNLVRVQSVKNTKITTIRLNGSP
jgi:hypothetical protein